MLWANTETETATETETETETGTETESIGVDHRKLEWTIVKWIIVMNLTRHNAECLCYGRTQRQRHRQRHRQRQRESQSEWTIVK